MKLIQICLLILVLFTLFVASSQQEAVADSTNKPMQLDQIKTEVQTVQKQVDRLTDHVNGLHDRVVRLIQQLDDRVNKKLNRLEDRPCPFAAAPMY